jgi:ubiquinone/menaquinone biosynthesis C-methylase UbiE
MSRTFDTNLTDRLADDARQVWPSNFADIEEMFNRCCFAIAVNCVRRLGLFGKQGEFENLSSIRRKTGLFKDAEYVMGHVLRILCEEDVLRPRDDGWECIDPDPYVETPAESLVVATRTFPEEGAPFQWLARSADGLVAFMKGDVYAEEVMFPMGSFTLVEEVYNTSNVYGFYSRLAGRTVARLVREVFSKPVTLLEVGAGTGNGTENVLNEVNDGFAKYYFTDVSKSLVQMGERRFKKRGYEFLEYRTFDACAALAEQQIEEESLDIVLAVNVLHATSDIEGALENARRLLRPDGILVLSEIAPPKGGIYRYMELTFGLLPSYNVYEDRARRPVAPIIRPDEWAEALTKAGFGTVEAVPGDRWENIDRGGVLLAAK